MSDIIQHHPTLKAISESEYGRAPLFLLSGPCVIESKDLCFEVAETMVRITKALNIPYIFKASYRKANRTREDGFRGIGDVQGLEILREVSTHFDIPVVTDIHESSEASMAAEYVDVLQIPAFLCRQTELLHAAGETGRYVNIKKGQFAAANTMKHAADKVRSTGNHQVWLTERGNSFGYEELVVDVRNLVEMRVYAPTIMDATHAVQRLNQAFGGTGGNRAMVETIAKAAVAVGADGLFLETHPDPNRALSDGANMVPLGEMERLLEKLVRLRELVVSL
jgi:2-dehydro-3-deoxyphosphooctonate aldolase (KDO 8-P synthase)